MKDTKLFEAFLTFLEEWDAQKKIEWKKEISAELESAQLQKIFYNLEEVAHITGIKVGALKGRIKRKTLFCVYDSTVILIPKEELTRLIDKLNKQYKRKNEGI